MKKILTAALALAVAATALTACSSKRYKPDESKSNVIDNTPVSVTEDAFEVPEDQKDFEVDIEMGLEENSIKLKAYLGEAEELEIPSVLVHPQYGELPVTIIGSAAFLGNETLKKVTVPAGVTEIGAGAFQSCSALTDVVLPDGLEIIGDSAFESSKLTNINIPSTVKKIGKHAFSTKLNPTPWYKAQTAQKVIVGDGILLKYNGVGDVTFGDEVKAVAYYAFQSPGEITVKFNGDLESFDSIAVYETEGTYSIKFLVPYKSNAERLLDSTQYLYSIHGVPEATGNPFKWTFDNDAQMRSSWTAGQLDMTHGADGSLHGVITSKDPRINCTDILNLPADDFKTLMIRMKHEINEAKSTVTENQFVFQIFYNNGTGISEANSVKHKIDKSSNGEYIDYAIDMSASEGWKDIIKGIRIDITDRLTGEFFIDSIEFVNEDESYDYNKLLKPVTKYVPEVVDETHKYKFEDEAKALLWTMAGFEYSYAPIKVAEEGKDAPANDSIHGVLDASAESYIVSPVVNVPGTAYRKLVVRMRNTFDKETDKNKDNYKMTAYFDNGEGFSKERSLTVDVKPNSGDEKVEYTFDMYTLDGWYGTVKQVKIVLPEKMGGEFWIDKIEFVPEEKLTKKDLVKMIYEAEGKPFVSSDAESIFLDVVVYDDYNSAVIWATDNGLVSRVANNMFYPDNKITDAEYVAVMNKYAALKGSAETFATTGAPVYKMDAENAIAKISAPAEEAAE